MASAEEQGFESGNMGPGGNKHCEGKSFVSGYRFNFTESHPDQSPFRGRNPYFSAFSRADSRDL